jgi:hypothetical protein
MRAETQRTRRLGADDDAILWPGEAQHVAGDLLDEIGIRLVRREEVDVALQFGAHGLKAPDLELQQAGAFDQSGSCLETVTAIDRVIGEIGRKAPADKQHKGLPRPVAPIMVWLTQHLGYALTSFDLGT